MDAPPREVNVVETRCEYQVNPLGIDEAHPRLSWALASDQRGQKQMAYQVLVASRPEKLAADTGDFAGTDIGPPPAQMQPGSKLWERRLRRARSRPETAALPLSSVQPCRHAGVFHILVFADPSRSAVLPAGLARTLFPGRGF